MAGAETARAALLKVDPLHHFVLAERYLAGPTAESRSALTGAPRSEYPDQELLELAVGYANRGLDSDALSILGVMKSGHDGPVARAWRAFLAEDAAVAGEPGDLAFAFPFRTETLPVLRWAAGHNSHWGWRYLLGLNLWALDRDREAAQVMTLLENEPDYAAAYVARGHLLQQAEGRDPGPDFARAVELDPGSRILRVALIRYLQDTGRWTDARDVSARGREIFPGDFNLDLLHARALLNLEHHQEAIDILAATHVLPSENARESHRLYELAHLAAALDELGAGNHDAARGDLEAALLWPESLGQGRPNDPDERFVRYLLGVAAARAGDHDAAREAFSAVAQGAEDIANRPLDRGDLPVILALHALGREPGLAVAEATARLLADNPETFADLEGRLLMRAVSLAENGASGASRR